MKRALKIIAVVIVLSVVSWNCGRMQPTLENSLPKNVKASLSFSNYTFKPGLNADWLQLSE